MDMHEDGGSEREISGDRKRETERDLRVCCEVDRPGGARRAISIALMLISGRGN